MVLCVRDDLFSTADVKYTGESMQRGAVKTEECGDILSFYPQLGAPSCRNANIATLDFPRRSRSEEETF